MSKPKILVVDDEAEILENIERLLEVEGYECETLQESIRFRSQSRSSPCPVAPSCETESTPSVASAAPTSWRAFRSSSLTAERKSRGRITGRRHHPGLRYER